MKTKDDKIISFISKHVIAAGMMALLLTACTDNLMVKENLIEYGPDEQDPKQQLEQQNQLAQQIQSLITESDNALMAGEFETAAKAYQSILDLDSGNLRAIEGLKRVDVYRQHAAWLAQAKPLVGKSEAEQEKAKKLLRNVLAENPNNVEAAMIFHEMMAAEDKKRLEALKVELNYDSPVSLEFRETDFKVIIEALAKGTGINFTLDSDIQRNLKASIFVRDVSIKDALNMLVESNGLRLKVLSEDSVLIYPDKVAKIRQYQDLIIRSFYLEYADPATVAGLLRSMLGVKQIETDDRLPMIMVKDVPEVMPLVEKLIISQDVPEPEVMLEMDIIEVSRNINQDTGFRWPTQLSVLSGQGALTLEALRNTDSSTVGVSPNPAILFDGQDSQINLLANPRIRVKNGESAKIHIGDRLPIITSNVASTGVISENVQYIDVGLKLDAEPIINLGGDVNISLNLDVSSIGNAITTNSGSVVYQIGTRSTSTQLRLKDGETQVLAGLINDSDRKNISKIPGLGDIPVIGRLFSTHGDEKIKTELVLMITPHIVRQTPTPNSALSEYWVGSEIQAGRSFTQPRTREEISKLFRAGTPPTAPRSQPEEQPSQAPEGLNIQLPPGLGSEF
jgi:general secretion pathway protein D